MPNNVEIGRVAEYWRCRNSRRAGIRRIGQVAGCRIKIRWRRDHRLRNEFRFVILLTEHGALFLDGCSVVIRSVTPGLTNVAPIGATKCHVYIEDSNAIPEIVLVEDLLLSASVQMSDIRAIERLPFRILR